MKIKREFEAEDINMDDPVNSAIMVGLLIAMLTGPKAQPGDPVDDKMYPIKRLIALMRTSFENDGIVISKSELPAVYKDG